MPGRDDVEIPFKGRSSTVRYARTRTGRKEAKVFLDGLDVRAKAEFYFLIATLADENEIVNEQKFKWLRGNIYELKVHQPGLRLLCFWHAAGWYLTHGCPKLKTKEFQAQIAKAERIEAEHLKWAEKNPPEEPEQSDEQPE